MAQTRLIRVSEPPEWMKQLEGAASNPLEISLAHYNPWLSSTDSIWNAETHGSYQESCLATMNTADTILFVM